MKVLILGGAGFIGGHLGACYAADGTRVDLVDNFQRAARDANLAELQAKDNVRLIELDLADADAVSGLDRDYDVIFHLAAIVGVRHVLERPWSVLHDNTYLTFNAIEIARRQTALQRFLFASTSEVVAAAVEEGSALLPTPETTQLVLPDLAAPRTSYMLSKIYGEALCAHSGLPATCFRPHNVYGPRMGLSHVIPELLGRAVAAEEGAALDVASVEHRRAFCFVDDAVNELIALARAETAKGGTYNIGNGDAEVAIGEVARAVLAVTGRADLSINALPPTAGSPSRRCPDMSQTIAATGYSPCIGLEEGIRRTFEWYRPVFENKRESAV